MSKALRTEWHKQHATLLEHAKKMKAQPVVDRQELISLQQEIRELERRIDRPLPPGTGPVRHIPGPREEKPGRAPEPSSWQERQERRCPFGRCDGSGWHLDDSDSASPCDCQRLPRDREARRQSKRVLRRHLALGLDSPPLSNLSQVAQSALRDFDEDLAHSVDEGRGLWFIGATDEVSAPCAFLAGEALRRAIPVLLYPGDELIGRLRRLAALSRAALDNEIYGRLANIDLLVVDGLDAAAAPSRFPESAPNDDDAGETNAEEESESMPLTPYRPGMTNSDLSRLALIINERLMGQKATIISTRFSHSFLEEDLLHLPGQWPDLASDWDEPGWRARQTKSFLSRLFELCGPPLRVEAIEPPLGSVRARGHARKGGPRAIRAAAVSSNQ